MTHNTLVSRHMAQPTTAEAMQLLQRVQQLLREDDLPVTPTRQLPPADSRSATTFPRSAQVANNVPPQEDVRQATIMIVDDEPINIKVVRKYLSAAGYSQFVTTSNSRQTVALVEQHAPDVIVLDIMMPEVSGLDVLRMLRADERFRHIPVLILTAADDPHTKLTALQLGATDFLNKPVDEAELVVRLRNMLIVKAHHDHLVQYSARLEREVRRRTAQLAQSRLELIHVLACAAEYRDQETGNHVIRVGRYAGIIARQLGLDPQRADVIEQAAILHDVGKIGIPDAILLKPGPLSHEEMEQMKKHCEYGLSILLGLPCHRRAAQHETRAVAQSPILRVAATIAISHHERWDGTGYPLGLAGEAIPLEGRIAAVADVFDAISSARPYKPAIPFDECLRIMEEQRGKHFDPRVLDAFVARKDEIRTVQQTYADPETK